MSTLTAPRKIPGPCGRWHPMNVPVPPHSAIEQWTPAELREEIFARTDPETHAFISRKLPVDVGGAEFLKYGGDRAYWSFIRGLFCLLSLELTCVADLMGLPIGFFYEEGKLDDTGEYWLAYMTDKYKDDYYTRIHIEEEWIWKREDLGLGIPWT